MILCNLTNACQTEHIKASCCDLFSAVFSKGNAACFSLPIPDGRTMGSMSFPADTERQRDVQAEGVNALNNDPARIPMNARTLSIRSLQDTAAIDASPRIPVEFRTLSVDVESLKSSSDSIKFPNFKVFKPKAEVKGKLVVIL